MCVHHIRPHTNKREIMITSGVLLPSCPNIFARVRLATVRLAGYFSPQGQMRVPLLFYGHSLEGVLPRGAGRRGGGGSGLFRLGCLWR